MWLSFGELKASEVPDDAGVCPDSPEFRNYTNKATRMLINRDAGQASFWGTVEKVQICTYGDCITWPRWVGTPMAVSRCGQPAHMWNNWFSFVPLMRSDWHNTLNGFDSGFSLFGGTCRGSLNIADNGTSPVMNPIACGKTMYIRAYPSTQQDVDPLHPKTTTIFGVDAHGQTIRTQKPDGTWQDGVTITLALPFVSTPFKIQTVTRILKDETQGPLRYYQYDADNNVLLDLVSYDPGETSPMYRCSKVHGARTNKSCASQACGGLKRVEALIKLEYVPVKYDSDRVLISNMDALRDMILSIKYAAAGDKTTSGQYELSAIRELNLEASTKVPKEQTPVIINPFGSGLPVQHGIGRII